MEHHFLMFYEDLFERIKNENVYDIMTNKMLSENLGFCHTTKDLVVST